MHGSRLLPVTSFSSYSAPTRRQRLRIRAPGARRDAEESLQIRCGQSTLLLATVARIRYPITIHRPASSFCFSNALISADRCVHGRAVQGQLRGRLPPGGWRRRRRRASGRAVDAGGGGRVQHPHHRVLGPFRSHRGRRRSRRCPVPYPLVHSGS